MTTEVKPGPRERLLEATATLTYRDGVGIGIEALCKAAGVSKRPMYQLFDSKDELLAASLEQGASAYAAGLLPGADDGRSPRERILHVFEQVELQAGAPGFGGCRYLAVQIELKDQGHPASQVAHQVKGNLVPHQATFASFGSFTRARYPRLCVALTVEGFLPDANRDSYVARTLVHGQRLRDSGRACGRERPRPHKRASALAALVTGAFLVFTRRGLV